MTPKTLQGGQVCEATSWQMFNDVAGTYDILNRMLSLGLDLLWRRRLCRSLPRHDQLKILDVATGTADVLIGIVKTNPNIQRAVGVDLAEKMLSIGRKKVNAAGLESRILLKTGDAQNLPFEPLSFDVLTIAFGLRNLPNRVTALMEMHRVLVPGGKLLILEFSLPENPLIRVLDLLYLKTIVPLVGGILSGHYQAYRYLNQTIEKFACGDRICRIIRQVGFQNVRAIPLSLGIATIYEAEKIAHDTFDPARPNV